MILSIIAMIFVLISSVSAANIDANITETSSTSDNNEISSVENDLEALSDDESTYSELSNQIGQLSSTNKNITLNHAYYKYDSDADSISIDVADSVIDGNGSTIDMMGSTIRAFEVKASGVTIKNLTIKNANFNGEYGGGAIYFNSDASFGTIENCNFTNNQAPHGDGGAIYFDSNGNVTNCNFTNNTADDWGGAIRMSSGTVSNCNFTGNRAYYGGAIRISSGTVSNCNFTENTASDSGGAIWFTENGNVTNCNFTNNQAPHGDGGAIYFDSNGNVTNCNLTDNKATSGNGGAIYFNSNGNITNCNFTDNQAKYNGGAIYFHSSGNVTNCNFTDNQATGENSWGGAIYIHSGTVSNCNFTDNQAKYNGGAIYFYEQGTVSNCNFTNNSARYGGAIRFNSNSTVTNCNFTDNQVEYFGGAIYFYEQGTVSNCNFTYNTASTRAGAIYFHSSGNVTNCNFTSNKATGFGSWGGAIMFASNGIITNCNFTGNNATTGSAIYFYSSSSTKTVSNSTFLNNRANAEFLEVTKNENNVTIIFTGKDNLLNAIYSNDDVSFTNVTYWGANGISNTNRYTPTRSNKEAGQNITIGIVVNDILVLNEVKVTDENGTIVLNITVGENYYILARHDTDAYYTGTEKPISNMTYNVNITSQTNNNKTVNITAKSNIYSEIMPGKLLFILPNTSEISANYTDYTWWAVHTFDDYGDFNVNASYSGLDEVTINDGTISIRRDVPIKVDDTTVVFGEVVNFVVDVPETLNGQNIKITVNETSKNTTVKNGEAKTDFIDLPAGEYNITVDYSGDSQNFANSTATKLTVNKANPTLIIENITLDYGESKNVTAKAEGATGITAKVDNETVEVKDNMISIPELDAGMHTLTINVAGDANHNSVTKSVDFEVKKTNATASATSSVTYNSGKDITITFKDANGKLISNASVTIDLNSSKDYVTDENGQINVSTKGLVPKSYTAKVEFKGTDNYNGFNTTANVTIKKATPKITAKAKTFKTTTKNKKYTPTLKNNKGKALKNKWIYLKVNGKTYKAKTNSKGKATFKLNNLTKVGKLKAKVTYKGNDYYKKATKKVKLTVKSTFKTVSRESKDKVTVKKIQRALKNNGFYLTENGHYLKVDGIYRTYTEKAVKQFQKSKGLKITGNVDEKTAEKLKII